MEPNLQLNKWWNWKIISFFKKKWANPRESFKLWLISQTYNPWNPRPKLNQEARLSINLMLKDQTKKKINLKKSPR
jgi:hypothetical protein